PSPETGKKKWAPDEAPARSVCDGAAARLPRRARVPARDGVQAGGQPPRDPVDLGGGARTPAAVLSGVPAVGAGDDPVGDDAGRRAGEGELGEALGVVR